MGRSIWICFRIWKTSHAASPKTAIRKYNVHSTVHHPVISVGRIACSSISGSSGISCPTTLTNSALDSVSDDRSTTQIRNIDPQFVAKVVLDQVVVQITVSQVRFVVSLATLFDGPNSHESHSGFYDSICTVDVHVYDFPHIASHIET
jgi:hypothetical protein